MVVIGGITMLLMIVISITILFQWRTLIVANQEKNASSVTKAISTSLTDAFIYGQKENTHVEDLLERYINNFMNSIEGIKYIAVYNNSRQILAHSDFTKYDQGIKEPIKVAVMESDSLITAIHNSEDYGWIIETVLPLRVASKRWGVLIIGFDAESMRTEIQKLFFLLFFITTCVIIVTLVVLYITIGRLTNSLRILVNAMDKTDIDSDTEISLPQRNDEIGFLNYRFGLLLKRLSHSKKQLVEAQKQIYNAEKLASIGRLASGVAHEINNPLNGIKNCLYAIYKEPANQQQTKEYLKLVEEGINYIETVVQKLLSFARQQEKAMVYLNINEVIQKVSRLLDFRIKNKQIQFQLDLDLKLPNIQADEQLITEVFMNILLNSIDAVNEAGSIIIKSRLLDPKQLYVSVIDNGIGINEDNLQNIFEPFYTTKGPKEGTGLGLSVSLGIVEAHRGNIEVKSIPNKETEFKVILPIKMEQ